MKIPSSFALIPQFKNALWTKMLQVYQQTARAINGNISFGQIIGGSNLINGAAVSRSQSVNIDGVWAFVTTPGAANTDFTIVHNLGRPVTGWLNPYKNAAVDVYKSPSANGSPNTQYIFRATVATVDIFLFIF